jgi:3-oxoacyl-[acyl-carrier-protein] synthase-3
MTGGAVRAPDGSLTPWSLHGSVGEAAAAGAFQLRQDVDALHRMLPVWMGEFMRLVDEGRIDPMGVDHFLCHFSAHSLREEMVKLATRAGCMIPEERWFTNIYEKGNVGAALDLSPARRPDALGPAAAGAAHPAGRARSGQCIMAYAGLTVVGDEQ